MACNISIQLWMAVFFVTVGFILHVISFSAPYWNRVGDEHWGLWQICDSQGCEAILDHHELSNSMKVGRGCQVLGLVAYIAVAVIVAIHIISKQTQKGISWSHDFRLLTASVFIAFIALISILFGSVLWSTGSNTTLFWCYYICYFSGLSAAALGGVLIYIRRQEFMATIEKEQTIGSGVV